MYVLSREGGLLGHLVIDRLQKMGEVAAVLGGSDVEGAESIPLDDRRAVMRALGYAKGLLVLPPGPQEAALDEERLLQLAHEAQLGRIISISVHGADPYSQDRALARQGHWDEVLLDSGIPCSILRPHLYMQDLLLFAPIIRAEKRLPGPRGEPRVGFVDVRDLADAAVAVLQRPFHMGEVYEITGSRVWSIKEVAEAVGEAIGETIRYDAVSLDDFERDILRETMDAKRARHIAQVLTTYAADTLRTRSMARITGLPPRALEMFLLDHRNHFASKPLVAGPVLAEAEVAQLDQPLSW